VALDLSGDIPLDDLPTSAQSSTLTTTSTPRRAPRVFISYAHESDEHAEAVRDLWIFLRAQGIDARLDRVAAQQRQDWALWMADQVRETDHVLVIASPAYRKRAEGRVGPDEGRGVQFEARLIRDAFYAHQDDLGRFVPVVLPGQSEEGVPDFLAPATCTVYRVSGCTLAGAESLVRLLLGQPAETEPPIGTPPKLGRRGHTLSGAGLRHKVVLHVQPEIDYSGVVGGIRTRTMLAGTLLGEQTAPLPPGWQTCWRELDSPTGAERLVVLGQRLWRVLLDEASGQRLVALIDHSPVGSAVDVTVHLAQEVTGLPVELLRLPDGRLAATVAGVRFTRRLDGVERSATGSLAGPLKILAAVAAPNETATPNPPLDVEAEMQALLDAVTDLDLTGEGAAQVRILEVASLAEITQALEADQYHVLHLSAHGSTSTVELEDEDGDPVTAAAADLVAALRAGERPLPLVVLSSCHAAGGGMAGLAATLVRHGADRVIAMQTTVTDGFATDLAREFYQRLAADPGMTVGRALAGARRVMAERKQAAASHGGVVRSEVSVPTLLAAGPDLPLRDPDLTAQPLGRRSVPPTGTGVRELPVGQLIGRRGPLRTATAVLRRNTRDRELVGDWAGIALTGIGGIGKTAVAGRILARAREQGWMIAEHVGTWNPTALIQSVAEALTDPAYTTVVQAL
jgi:hypothetical protein